MNHILVTGMSGVGTLEESPDTGSDHRSTNRGSRHRDATRLMQAVVL